MIITNKGFARGAISPYLYARPDLVDYVFGVRTLRNFLVTKEGAAQTRPGMAFVDECRSPSTEKRLIPFVFSTTTADTYILEFGDQYMEVVRAGGRVVESTVAITGITAANPPVVTTSGAHSYSSNDHVYIASVSGMTQVNGRRFQITVTGATTFTLQDTSGTNIDASAYTAYSSGGTSARVYKIATPYVEADLQTLKFAQSADVMTITHPTYAPRELSRTGHTSWTLSSGTYATPWATTTSTNPDLTYSCTPPAGSNTYYYQITQQSSLTSYTNVESLPHYPRTTNNITGITNANPAVVTCVAHGIANGEEVYLNRVSGMTEVNNRRFIAANVAADTFELQAVNSAAYGVWTGASSVPVFRTSLRVASSAAPTATAPIPIVITPNLSGITSGTLYTFQVYKELNGVFGWIGSVSREAPFTTVTFNDVGVTPDTSDTPPTAAPMFDAATEYPSCVAYHQQRIAFANSSAQPETIWLSRLGSYQDFGTHSPLLEDDSIEYPLNSQEVNPIRHLVPLRKLVCLTGSQEWVIEGNDAGTITPSAFNARAYTNQGSSDVRPAIVDNDILYVQSRGNQVRSLFYDFGSDSYNGEDLTIKASHLFRGYGVRDMAYAKIPDSVLWTVRNDGELLSMTYSRKEQIVAWAEHTTDGTFEQVCTIPENDSEDIGGEDAVYVLVKRTINSRVVRHIERLKERYVSSAAREDFTWTSPDRQEELTQLDSFLTYDGRNTGSVTLTLSGSGWTASDTLTLTASSSTFLSTDVGTDATSRKFFIYDADGNLVVLRVTQYTSPTVVSVLPDRTVPAALQATARTTWAAAVRRVTGLWHIEGESVSALGDGFEIANALLDSTAITVSSGIATFGESDFSSVIHVGLPIASDIELLDVENPEGQSLYGKKKIVKNVGVYVKGSRSFFAGNEIPDAEDEDYDENLQEECYTEESEDPDYPSPLRTEHIDVSVPGEYTEHGRAVIRNLRPFPLTILAISRSVEVKG